MKSVARTLLIFLLLFAVAIAHGQVPSKNKYSREPKKKIKLVCNLDGRNSFVINKNGHAVSAKIGGLKMGIQYKDLFRTGIGFYGLS